MAEIFPKLIEIDRFKVFNEQQAEKYKEAHAEANHI